MVGLKCAKCGGATELVSVTQPLGERPMFRIFECGSCKAQTWIAGAVSKRDSPSLARELFERASERKPPAPSIRRRRQRVQRAS
jgi:hypothetical protein